MSTRPSEQTFYDSEATLRLVDTVLYDLRGLLPAEPTAAAAAPEPARPRLRLVPGSRAPAAGGLEQFHAINARLQEFTTATEVAATDILDSLERALAVIDRLEEGSPSAGERRELQAELREELFGVMGSVQIQEVTRQQLRYAAGVLAEVETRLTANAPAEGPAGL